jgi:hypothetical protein
MSGLRPSSRDFVNGSACRASHIISNTIFKRSETHLNSTYKDLLVWQRAMDLTLEVYRSTKTFPREENTVW